MLDSRRKKKKQMSRRDSRIEVMSLLYEISITFADTISEVNVSKLDAFAMTTFKAYMDHRESVDNKISEILDGWTLNSIAKIDLAILRLATTEYLYVDDVPTQVSVSEAVEIAKIYGDDNSPSFVNSIMRKIVK